MKRKRDVLEEEYTEEETKLLKRIRHPCDPEGMKPFWRLNTINQSLLFMPAEIAGIVLEYDGGHLPNANHTECIETRMGHLAWLIREHGCQDSLGEANLDELISLCELAGETELEDQIHSTNSMCEDGRWFRDTWAGPYGADEYL